MARPARSTASPRRLDCERGARSTQIQPEIRKKIIVNNKGPAHSFERLTPAESRAVNSPSATIRPVAANTATQKAGVNAQPITGTKTRTTACTVSKKLAPDPAKTGPTRTACVVRKINAKLIVDNANHGII